ncbi:MAG: flagellar hook-basal body protein [Eubacteriales bacterium]
MIRSLYSGTSGMKNHQIRMDVIGNNIANVNTIGYKSSRANFQDMLYQFQRSPSVPGDNGAGSINPSQVGTGVLVSSIGTNMGQGAMQNTGRVLDLAIQGNGFFQLKDNGGNFYYTRNGIFNQDANGCIVDNNGYQLTDVDGSEIRIEGQVGELSVGKDGVVTATDTSGVDMGVSAQIGLFSFANPEGLSKIGQNLYKETTTANGSVSGQATLIDMANATSSINSGYLEMSNVDLIDELANMIVTQRGYQANIRTITTSDQMLTEILDIKR